MSLCGVSAAGLLWAVRTNVFRGPYEVIFVFPFDLAVALGYHHFFARCSVRNPRYVLCTHARHTSILADVFSPLKDRPVAVASADRDALEAVFRWTGGDNSRRKANWATDADLSTWGGVKVDEDGCVVELEFVSLMSGDNPQGILRPVLRMRVSRSRRT